MAIGKIVELRANGIDRFGKLLKALLRVRARRIRFVERVSGGIQICAIGFKRARFPFQLRVVLIQLTLALFQRRGALDQNSLRVFNVSVQPIAFADARFQHAPSGRKHHARIVLLFAQRFRIAPVLIDRLLKDAHLLLSSIGSLFRILLAIVQTGQTLGNLAQLLRQTRLFLFRTRNALFIGFLLVQNRLQARLRARGFNFLPMHRVVQFAAASLKLRTTRFLRFIGLFLVFKRFRKPLNRLFRLFDFART